MNHDLDYDRDNDREDAMNTQALQEILQQSVDKENELMRTYLMTAERIHANFELKNCLSNFAEGNAKRTKQLMEELSKLQ